jgi:hypothetical protein
MVERKTLSVISKQTQSKKKTTTTVKKETKNKKEATTADIEAAIKKAPYLKNLLPQARL